MLKPDRARIILLALMVLVAYGGYAQSWAFSGKDAGLAPPPLARLFQPIPFLWETWVLLLVPLVFILHIVERRGLFETGPAWASGPCSSSISISSPASSPPPGKESCTESVGEGNQPCRAWVFLPAQFPYFSRKHQLRKSFFSTGCLYGIDRCLLGAQAEFAEAMAKAGIDPAIIYAYRRTGLIVTTENQHLLSEEDLEEWNAALAEYDEKLKSKPA